MDMIFRTTLIDRYLIYAYSETKAAQKVDTLLAHSFDFLLKTKLFMFEINELKISS